MMSKESPGPIITDTTSHWNHILEHAQKRIFPANKTLLYPGDKATVVYYVLKGEVLVSSYSTPSDLNRLFIIRENSFLGLIGLFNQKKSMATWYTLTPCTCYVMDKEYIYSRAPRELLLDMLEQLATMSSSMTRRFAKGNVKRLEVRFARMLIHLTDACTPYMVARSNKVVIKPNLTQKMISELLDMHYVTLNRIIKSFKQQGILGEFKKTQVEILEIDTLRRYAEGKMPPLVY